MFKMEKQLNRLYLSSILGNLSLTGAWVAILAARGYSLVEIGIAETAFHITSLLFELPSGVLADVFGRKKMLVVSAVMRMIGNLVMILSWNLPTVCLSIAFQALSYNFASGSGDALAYDSLKSAHQESRFERYESNQLTIYRLCGGLSTLCAGFALFIGHRIAYGVDLIACAMQIAVLSTVQEFYAAHPQRLLDCFSESLAFLKKAKPVLGLMLCNSFIGAFDVLLLFFLQAKLPQRGLANWGLGLTLLFMELGGVLGGRLILKCPKVPYRKAFAASLLLVALGFLAEHSPLWPVMSVGGFLSAMGDDALQVRTNAKIQHMLPSDQRATLTSVESFTFSVIMIVLSPIAGFVFTHW